MTSLYSPTLPSASCSVWPDDAHRYQHLGKFSPLTFASYCGNDVLVQNLLQSNDDVNQVDRHGYTPLWWACLAGHLRTTAPLLIEHGADLQVLDSDGCSLLFHAILTDDADLLESLLDWGATLQCHDKVGDTPLMVAARHHHVESLKVLLRYTQKSDAHSKNTVCGSTPLHLAIACQQSTGSKVIETAELLLDAGAKVDASDKAGWNPFLQAYHVDNVGLIYSMMRRHPEIWLRLKDSNESQRSSDHLPVFSRSQSEQAQFSR